LRKAGEIDFAKAKDYTTLQPQEKDIILQLFEFPNIIEQAANDYDPSHVGAYCYNLAKLYHKFWHDLPMLKAETEAAKVFRLMLSTQLAKTLQFGMDLLGIEMPHKM
jgi:arginyl-tRNA synthetase